MTQMIDVLLPAEQAEGTRSQVLRWLKAVGQPVTKHEPLVEIETDKVTIEVPAPADGVLGEILAAEGVDVAPGALLGRLQAGAAASVAAPLAPVPAAVAGKPEVAATAGASSDRMSPAVRRLLAEHGLTAAQVRGTGDAGRITVDDVLAASKRGATAAATATAARCRRRVPQRPRRRACGASRTRRCGGASRPTWSRACCRPRRT